LAACVDERVGIWLDEEVGMLFANTQPNISPNKRKLAPTILLSIIQTSLYIYVKNKIIARLLGTQAMHRNNLLNIFNEAIAFVNGRESVKRFLTQQTLGKHKPIYLIALGKAAASMAQGAHDILGPSIQEGLVITKVGHGTNLPFRILEAAHPIPDERSLEAGNTLLDFLKNIPKHSHVLFLISGGTSSLVEVLPKGFTLDNLMKLNQKLLACGLPISDINRIRSEHSQIKGGKLVKYLNGLQTTALFISDVPGDHLPQIGSGLLFPNNFIKSYIVASLKDALHAAAKYAAQLGYPVDLDETFVTGDAAKVGTKLANELIHGTKRLMIRGGETTVVLPKNSGQGGRNQHLALSAACVLKDYDNVFFLSGGTDGTDGPTEFAGAMVDSQTIAKGQSQGLSEKYCLENANSQSFLKAAGALIKTGPTGTNVMDIMLGLKT